MGGWRGLLRGGGVLESEWRDVERVVGEVLHGDAWTDICIASRLDKQ